MTNEKLYEVLGDINEKHINEARAYHRAKKPGWVKWGTMAACLCLMVVTAVSVLPNYLNQQGTIPLDNPNGVIVDNPTDDTMPATSEIHISMSNIVMNQISDSFNTDYARYNPETDIKVVWNREDIIAYYGTDLVPAYIPDGFSASGDNNKAIAYIGQDGSVVEDTVYLDFYKGEAAQNGIKQGFSITASKIGIVQTCYVLPEDKLKTSDIGGTTVAFGHRSVPNGPYDPDTHEPSGYYDMYVAEFEYNGIEYEIVAEQMEAEEVVKVVSSIIYGEEVFIDK
ncbi:hypothetical protein [uncultured Intestinimonas sp.]|uniref:hypothetical protein n=1 Tax=uncultured Intestinimonas sp. TaxID=1689265 RepID=UPI0025FD0909|nr:hypothetical protein [uncultured Intestinimonas sp.]